MYVGGSALEPGHYAAVRGMNRGADKMAQAASDIVQVTMDPSMEQSSLRVRGLRSVDAAGSGPAVVRDFEGAFNDLTMGDQGYRANLRTARASDAQFQQLVDMALPQGYSRLVGNQSV